MNDSLLLESSEVFKGRLLNLNVFSEDERNEILRSDISFMNIKFGVTPNQMSETLLVKIMMLESWFNGKIPLPLLPSVKESWTGSRLADWLITAKIVDSSKREIISEKLNGKSFLEGCVLDVLTPWEVKQAVTKLIIKLDVLSELLWDMTQSPNNMRAALGVFFRMDFGQCLPIGEFQVWFMEKYALALPDLKPYTTGADVILAKNAPSQRTEEAFRQPYLYYDEISNSFIGHIQSLIYSNPNLYFACYSFVGQSSCCGKSRLISESLENEDTALFILKINCKVFGESRGYPNAGYDTSLLVNRIMDTKSQLGMELLIYQLLLLALTRAFDEEEEGYFLKEGVGLSSSLEDLQIRLDDVVTYKLGSTTVENTNSILRISKILKVRRTVDDEILTKKVIFVVAFDEAGRFIDHSFSLEGESRPEGIDEREKKRSGPTELNTFRLIRRVLCLNKTYLWNVPFVFCGTNTRFGNFVPDKSRYPSDRRGFGPNDEISGGCALFDPYVLLASFDVYAKNFNYGPGLDANWKEYIESVNYPYHICNIGRPSWGSALSAILKVGCGADFIEDSRKGSCIPENRRDLFVGALGAVHEEAIGKIRYIFDARQTSDRVESAVAILHIITGSGWIFGPLASSLVEKRMGLLLDYRYDTSQLRVIYPSEPVLAILALQQFHEHPASIMSDVLLSYDCLTGSLGDIGEFGARIIFLLALDTITLKQPFCTVRSFLRNLIGGKLNELENKARNDQQLRSILNGFISFSHFAKAHKICENPLVNIGVLVNLNAALSTPQNFQGVDTVIPVVLDNGRLGCINVQVKSHARKLYSNEIGNIKRSIISSGFCSKEFPSLNLIINVGPEHQYSCNLQDPTPKANGAYTIIIQGISGNFPLYKKFNGVEEKLKQLLNFGRFEVDFRQNKANVLPVSASLPAFGARIWSEWDTVNVVKEGMSKATKKSGGKPGKKRKTTR
jgi:hypothetical protein